MLLAATRTVVLRVLLNESIRRISGCMYEYLNILRRLPVRQGIDTPDAALSQYFVVILYCGYCQYFNYFHGYSSIAHIASTRRATSVHTLKNSQLYPVARIYNEHREHCRTYGY